MKLLNIFLSVTILLIGYENNYCQNIPITTTMPTPYGNIPSTYYIASPFNYYGSQGLVSLKYKYKIVLQNDSTIIATTAINISGNKHFVTVKRKKERYDIKPFETKSITQLSYDGYNSKGIPADSCWLFKVGEGKINSYSFLPEASMDMVIAIQIGDGPIVGLSEKALMPIMADKPKLVQLIEEGKYIKAIQAYNFKKPIPNPGKGR